MTEHTITKPLLRDTVPEQMRHVAVSLADGSEIEAAVIYMDSTGIRLSLDEGGRELFSFLKKGCSLEVDFVEIPLHVAAQCTLASEKEDGKELTMDVIVSNPFQQKRYRNFLQHYSTRSEKRCLMDK